MYRATFGNIHKGFQVARITVQTISSVHFHCIQVEDSPVSSKITKFSVLFSEQCTCWAVSVTTLDVLSSVLARCSLDQTPPALSGEFGRFQLNPTSREFACAVTLVLEWLFVVHKKFSCVGCLPSWKLRPHVCLFGCCCFFQVLSAINCDVYKKNEQLQAKYFFEWSRPAWQGCAVCTLSAVCLLL